MTKRLTSKDLARLAGVSSATVSRAFTPDARINQATRSRILSIAEEHDYQPNAIARSLNSQRSRLVALVVNSIENPCEAQQLQELVQLLQERELLPIILCCAGLQDRLQLMRIASAYQLDHVVIFSDMVSLEDAVQIFRTTRPIIVSFEPVAENKVSHVRFDGSKAAGEIIAKAVGDGRRHFAYLTGRQTSWIDKQRKAWFADALAKHGLAFESEGHGDYGYDSGFKEAVVLLRRSKVDAVICGNDVMAIGLRDAATRVLGKRVPEDLAIVGQDGIAMAAWESHDLTTLALDQHAFIAAILRLIDRQRSDENEPSTVTLTYTVRWGATC